MDYFSHIRKYIEHHINDSAVTDLATHYVRAIVHSSSSVPDGKIILPGITAKDLRVTPYFWRNRELVSALMILTRHRLAKMLCNHISESLPLTTEQLFDLADCIESCTPNADVKFVQIMEAVYTTSNNRNHKPAYEVSYLG